MAVSKIISDDYCEIDFKVHYDYYGSERCTLMSVSLRELLSLGFIGLEGLIQTQIKYLGRMPAVRIMYKDDENDFIDLLDTNFNRFIRQVRTFQARCDFPVVNLKVVEGSSPAGIKSVKLDAGTGSSCTRLEQNCEPVARRELDFQTDHEPNFLDYYAYKSPLDHSIEVIEEEISELETQTQSARDRLTDLTDKYCSVVQGRGKQCSNCHLRLDHNIRQCRIDKCVTPEQCGDLSKHPDEKMLVDSASDCLKKVERELLNKRTEYETRLKAKNSSAMSFAQKVRTHLINSNKKKYLIKTTEGYVPKSATVNIDLAKLEKHFKGKVPDDLDRVSELFEGIINKFDNSKRPPCTSTQGNPAKRLLEENTIFPVKFPNINTGSQHVHSASASSACAPTWGTPSCSLPPKKR